MDFYFSTIISNLRFNDLLPTIELTTLGTLKGLNDFIHDYFHARNSTWTKTYNKPKYNEANDYDDYPEGIFVFSPLVTDEKNCVRKPFHCKNFST